MLKKYVSFISVFVLSFFSLFALYTPSVSAATLTWTGDGSDHNFSTPENWDPQQAPEDGDSLTFDHDFFDFGDWDSGVDPFNDIEDLEVAVLQVQGEGDRRLAIDGEQLILTETISNSSNNGISVNLLGLSDDVNYDYSGSHPLGSLITNELYLNGYLLTANETVTVIEDVIGEGDFTMDSGILQLSSITEYDSGEITLEGESSSQINPTGADSNDQISINGSNQSFIGFCGNTDFEFAGDITIGGEGNSFGAISFAESCGSGGGSGATEEPPEMNLNLSGLVELTADTKVQATQNQTISIENIENNGYSISLTEDSSGALNVEGDEFTNEPETIVIEEGDDSSDSVTVLEQDTVILNGTRGALNVFGTLKGVGSAESIAINGGAILAPGLSPGCMQTDELDFFSTGVYEVEIGGTEACAEYDQMQVSDSVNLNGATLDVSLIDDFTPSAGDEFVIILNEGSDPVGGTFDGLDEEAEFTAGDATFSITYEGGEDNNDVVLTVLDASEETPDAPDTGFALIMSSPMITLLVTVATAGGLIYISRRQLKRA